MRTALEMFRDHLEACDHCRDNKEDLCPMGDGLRLDVFYEGLTAPNTVRGINPIVCSCIECRHSEVME